MPKSFDEIARAHQSSGLPPGLLEGRGRRHQLPALFRHERSRAACVRKSTRYFEATTHRFISQLLKEGKIDGLRVDHPDGLYDPAEYFRRLQEMMGNPSISAGNPPAYVVMEKILTGDERIPSGWPVWGTTGYEFVNLS